MKRVARLEYPHIGWIRGAYIDARPIIFHRISANVYSRTACGERLRERLNSGHSIARGAFAHYDALNPAITRPCRRCFRETR